MLSSEEQVPCCFGEIHSFYYICFLFPYYAPTVTFSIQQTQAMPMMERELSSSQKYQNDAPWIFFPWKQNAWLETYDSGIMSHYKPRKNLQSISFGHVDSIVIIMIAIKKNLAVENKTNKFISSLLFFIPPLLIRYLIFL